MYIILLSLSFSMIGAIDLQHCIWFFHSWGSLKQDQLLFLPLLMEYTWIFYFWCFLSFLLHLLMWILRSGILLDLLIVMGCDSSEFLQFLLTSWLAYSYRWIFFVHTFWWDSSLWRNYFDCFIGFHQKSESTSI